MLVLLGFLIEQQYPLARVGQFGGCHQAGKPGAGLGMTSGWVHRASLQMKQVTMLAAVNYEAIEAQGLRVSFGEKRERAQLIEVDQVVICAGQESVRDLDDVLKEAGVEAHVIGGAALAGELDAKRAIKQGTELAAKL